MKMLLPLCLAALLAMPALANPPAHAPAHGYRNKDKAAKYRGYTGVQWAEDYGVGSGRCNTDAVLAVVGATAGAVIGNRTADAGDRTIATIAGAVIGGVLGHEIGEAIDAGDRACLGHSLEVGKTGQSVSWTNPRTRVSHSLTPVRDLPGGCRQFTYRVGERGKAQALRACRNPQGQWLLQR